MSEAIRALQLKVEKLEHEKRSLQESMKASHHSVNNHEMLMLNTVSVESNSHGVAKVMSASINAEN